MKNITINKTFANLDECKAWEDENLERIAKENGGMILVIHHTEAAGQDEVTLNYITLI